MWRTRDAAALLNSVRCSSVLLHSGHILGEAAFCTASVSQEGKSLPLLQASVLFVCNVKSVALSEAELVFKILVVFGNDRLENFSALRDFPVFLIKKILGLKQI